MRKHVERESLSDLKRWRVAQKHEKEYWKQVKNQITSEDKLKSKMSYAKDVSRFLKKPPILQVGAGADPMINFMDCDLKIGLDPLSDFYKTISMGYQDFEKVTGVSEHIPFADQSIGSVICFNMLDHVHDTKRTLREISRVLKPAGRLFLMVHVKSTFIWLYRKVVKDPLHPSPLHRKRLLTDLRDLGFKVLRDNSDPQTLRIFFEKA